MAINIPTHNLVQLSAEDLKLLKEAKEFKEIDAEIDEILDKNPNHFLGLNKEQVKALYRKQANGSLVCAVDTAKDNQYVMYIRTTQRKSSKSDEFVILRPKNARIVSGYMTTNEFTRFIRNATIDLNVYIEACSASNYFASYIEEQGRLRGKAHKCNICIVTSIREKGLTTKTDERDAFDLLKAAITNQARFANRKSDYQRQLSSLVTAKNQATRHKVQTINSFRALLLEQGVSINKDASFKTIKKNALNFLHGQTCYKDENSYNLLRRNIELHIKRYEDIDQSLKEYESELKRICISNPECLLLQTIPGVGINLAISLFIAGNNIDNFHNAKHFASYIGISPLVVGSGGVNTSLEAKHKVRNKELAGKLYIAALSIYATKLKSKLLCQNKTSINLVKKAEEITDEQLNALSKRALSIREKGAKPIVCSIAHHIAKTAYAVLKYKKPYDESKASAYLTGKF